MALCEILEISDIYTAFIGENPNDPFRNLNEQGKKKAFEYITLLEQSGEYEKPKADIIPFEPRVMRIALMPTSAAVGRLFFPAACFSKSPASCQRKQSISA